MRPRVAERARRGGGEIPQDGLPQRRARLRARWGLGIVLGAWIGADVAIGLLVRAHRIHGGSAGYSLGVGLIACFVVWPVFYGTSSRPSLVVADGRQLVVARTLTGLRVVDLGALASVRRFVIPTRGSDWDELRLRDRHGARLAIGRCEGEIEEAVRTAAAASGAPVSRAAMERLNRRLRVPRDGTRKFLGWLAVLCCVEACVVGSLLVTYLISGTSGVG